MLFFRTKVGQIKIFYGQNRPMSFQRHPVRPNVHFDFLINFQAYWDRKNKKAMIYL